MFLLLMRIVCCSLFIAWAGSAAATTVMVQSTSEDTVGQSIVYQLRDQINKSSIYKLVYSEDDAGFVINIVTVEGDPGRTTAYSATLLMPPFDKKGYDYFITSSVGYCGASKTEQCASQILAGFDNSMSKIASALSEALKRNKN